MMETSQLGTISKMLLSDDKESIMQAIELGESLDLLELRETDEGYWGTITWEIQLFPALRAVFETFSRSHLSGEGEAGFVQLYYPNGPLMLTYNREKTY
jgi:hypothetical protein